MYSSAVQRYESCVFETGLRRYARLHGVSSDSVMSCRGLGVALDFSPGDEQPPRAAAAERSASTPARPASA